MSELYPYLYSQNSARLAKESPISAVGTLFSSEKLVPFLFDVRVSLISLVLVEVEVSELTYDKYEKWWVPLRISSSSSFDNSTNVPVAIFLSSSF